MEDMANYLQALSDSLDKKIGILDRLAILTDEQRNIATAQTFDDEEFQKTLDEKEELIGELTRLDTGFQILYDNIKAGLDKNREMYKNEIQAVQSRIKKILDKNTALQVAENNNRNLISKRFTELKREVHQVRKSRDTAANYYKTMNNITAEPYFMDQKK